MLMAGGLSGRRTTGGLVVTLLLMGIGCEERWAGPSIEIVTLDGAEVTLVDSAGLSIVQSIAPAWKAGQSGWAVSSSPSLRIGSVDDSILYLAGVRGVGLGPGGEVAVGNSLLNEVRTFSAQGEPRWRQGRRGAGPGEYEYILDLRECGDYLIVRDGAHRRLTILDWRGDVVLLRRYSAIREGTTPSALACNRTGQFAQVDRKIGARAGAYLATAVVSTGDLMTGEGLILSDSPGFLRYRIGNSDAPSDLGMQTLVGMSDSLVHVVVTDRAEILSYGLDGGLKRIIRWNVAARAIDPRFLKELATRRSGVLGPSLRAAYERQWMELPHPDSLALVDRLLVSSDGELWLRQFGGYQDPSEKTAWWVFSTAGAWLGTVLLPAGFDMVGVTPDAVFGVHRDETGVEFVEFRVVLRRNAVGQ